MRGLAALTVFIAHAGYDKLFPEQTYLESFYQIFKWHNISVDLFFDLSGFILCYVYCSKNFTWKDYFKARFARIYPLYFAGLAFFIGLAACIFLNLQTLLEHVPLSQALANVLLVQDWPLLPHFWSVNVPTWSISVEVFLYIFIFPILYYIRPYLGFWPRCLLTVVPAMMLAGLYLFIYKQWQDSTTSFFGPFRGILCFISGFFCCTLGLDRSFPGHLPRSLEALFLILTASSLLFEFPLGREVIVIAFPALLYLSAQQASLLSRLIVTPVLCWLGDISYSIYVWHWPIMNAAAYFFGLGMIAYYPPSGASTAFRLLFVLVSMVSVIGIAHLSHFYFERPVSRWLRRQNVPNRNLGVGGVGHATGGAHHGHE